MKTNKELMKMYFPNKNLTLGFLISSFILSCVLFFWQSWNSFRIVFGSIFVLFLPGYFLTYNFFKPKEIDYLERLALSFALSISVIPLLVFYTNIIGLRINALNVSITIILVILISILINKYLDEIKRKFKKKK